MFNKQTIIRTIHLNTSHKLQSLKLKTDSEAFAIKKNGNNSCLTHTKRKKWEKLTCK